MEKNLLSFARVNNIDSDVSLVFLHGSTMTKEEMIPVTKAFLGYNCICLDLTAHGESEGEMPKCIGDIAKDVEYTITQLRADNMIGKKLVLLGYSMGGAIVCEIALRKKIQCDGIVFLSSGADLVHYTPAVDQLKTTSPMDFRVEDIVDVLFGNIVEGFEKEQIKSIFLNYCVSSEIGYNDLMISNAYDCLDRVKEIEWPVLIVHGNEDAIILPEAAIQTWQAIEKSQLLLVPYGGHALIYEDPKVVADAVNRFLENIEM